MGLMSGIAAKAEWFFPYVRKGSLFGTDIRLCLPRQLGREFDMPEFVSTNNTVPGRENLGFYDIVYNPDNVIATHIADCLPGRQTADADTIEAAINRGDWPENFIGARRWYSAAILCKDELVFNDIWVHRNPNFGDLREADQLCKAHTFLIDIQHFLNGASEADSDNMFSEPAIISGANWRDTELNGRRWLSYEEYSNNAFWGASWITPIGREHYIQLRLYLMVKNHIKEYAEALEYQIEQVTKNIRIGMSVATESSSPSRENELADIAGETKVKELRRVQNTLEQATEKDFHLKSGRTNNNSIGRDVFFDFFAIPLAVATPLIGFGIFISILRGMYMFASSLEVWQGVVLFVFLLFGNNWIIKFLDKMVGKYR